MIQKFKESLSCLLEDKELYFTSESSPRILLAVSGGIDSMCMAHLFERSFYKNIAIATVNFQLRDEESDADEELVRLWAETRGIKFFSTSFRTKEYAQEHGISTQMAARDLRYSWFYSLMDEHSFDYLAVAHNLNDSVETFFLNSLRGTGIQGLCGIRRKNDRVIRPLLSITRDEIARYIKAENIPFRDDMTNFESHYSRNRLRNLVFPEFEEINPSFLRTIERSMKNVESAADVLDDLFEQKRVHLFDEERGRIDIEKLSAEKRPEYWLFLILAEYGFNPLQVEQIKESLSGQSGKEFHSESHLLLRDRQYLLLYPKDGYHRGATDKSNEVAKSPQGLNNEVVKSVVNEAVSSEQLAVSSDQEAVTGDKFELMSDQEAANIMESAGSIASNSDAGQGSIVISDMDFIIELDIEPEESIQVQESRVAGSNISLPAVGRRRRITVGDRILEFSLYNKPAGFLPKRRRQMSEMSGTLFGAVEEERIGEIIMMDAEKLGDSPLIRPWNEGDRFIPLGMKGFKKISDYLIDIKMDKISKDNQLVLLSGDNIAALIGHRVDDRFKITPVTSKILEIRFLSH